MISRNLLTLSQDFRCRNNNISRFHKLNFTQIAVSTIKSKTIGHPGYKPHPHGIYFMLVGVLIRLRMGEDLRNQPRREMGDLYVHSPPPLKPPLSQQILRFRALVI